MFSPNDLIHLVFADEADTYYCEDLLKPDLHQYLWLKLHEKYSSVYFLTLSENTFSVKTYGDLNCKPYEPPPKFLTWMGGSEMKDFGKWVLRQLTSRRSESAAFVCSLEDLCQAAAEHRDWAGALEDIAGAKARTGIFVLTVPVSVERSRPLLLHDPVFEHLRENAVLDVRNGALRELYGSLKRNKGESCVFLNAFSWDRVYPVLLHVMLEQPGRFLPQKDMEAVIGYLVRYLADLKLQRDDPLFNSRAPGSYMQFRELYDELKDEKVWTRLVGRSLKERSPADNRAEHAEPAMGFHMTRDKSGYAGKCMTLQIPNGIRRLDTQGRAVGLLLDIQRELLRPKNRDENEMLAAKAAGFLAKLEAVAPDDPDTCQRILEAVHFCVTWMYVRESEEEKRVLEIVESLEMYVKISNQYWLARKNVDLYKLQNASGTITDIKIQQAQKQLEAQEKILRTYQDLVSASSMDLSILSFSDNITEQTEKLDRAVEKFRSARNTVSQGGVPESGDLSDPPPDDDWREDKTGIYQLDDIAGRSSSPI